MQMSGVVKHQQNLSHWTGRIISNYVLESVMETVDIKPSRYDDALGKMSQRRTTSCYKRRCWTAGSFTCHPTTESEIVKQRISLVIDCDWEINLGNTGDPLEKRKNIQWPWNNQSHSMTNEFILWLNKETKEKWIQKGNNYLQQDYGWFTWE